MTGNLPLTGPLCIGACPSLTSLIGELVPCSLLVPLEEREGAKQLHKNEWPVLEIVVEGEERFPDDKEGQAEEREHVEKE